MDTPTANLPLDQMRPPTPSSQGPTMLVSTSFQLRLPHTAQALSPDTAAKPDSPAVEANHAQEEFPGISTPGCASPAGPAAAQWLADLEHSMPTAGSSDLAASPFVASLARSLPLLSPDVSPVAAANSTAAILEPAFETAPSPCQRLLPPVEVPADEAATAEEVPKNPQLSAASAEDSAVKDTVGSSLLAATAVSNQEVLLQTPGASPNAWSELWDSSPESTGAESAVKCSPEPTAQVPSAVKAPSVRPQSLPRTIDRRWAPCPPRCSPCIQDRVLL